MSQPSQSPASAAHTKWPVAFVIGVLGSLVVTLVVLAFLWPTKTMTAAHLPVSVVGPEVLVTAFEDAMNETAPGKFELVAADSRDQAVAQIEHRKTYGAIIFSASPEVLTAPAASSVSAQMLTGLANLLQGQLQQQVTASGGDGSSITVTVTPVVSFNENDSNGTGLIAASFPLVLGGMIGGILISLLVVGVIRRLVALTGFALATGLVLTLVLQSWYGYLQGNWGLNFLAIAGSIAAISAFIIGTTSLLGRPGIAVGAIITMLVANPLSAAAVPYQFLVQPWGFIGQLMVPGAANSLLRSISYFPTADAAFQWWVILSWLVTGVVLALIGHFRAQQSMKVPAASLDAASA